MNTVTLNQSASQKALSFQVGHCLENCNVQASFQENIIVHKPVSKFSSLPRVSSGFQVVCKTHKSCTHWKLWTMCSLHSLCRRAEPPRKLCCLSTRAFSCRLLITTETSKTNIFSDLDLKNICLYSFISELWHDLFTFMAVSGDLHFSEVETVHSWLLYSKWVRLYYRTAWST